MAHPLDSAFAKLGRAVEHLKETEAELDLFRESNPYVPIVDYNFDSGEHTLRVRVLGDPPLRLGLLAGDALHNLRSALDHLVYQLADLDPKVPRGGKTQYPIFDTPDDFDAMPASYLTGVPLRYLAMLREAQPYKVRYALLSQLARLDNRDKHRIVEPLAGSTVGAILRTADASPVTDIRGIDGVVYFDDGAVLGHFRSKVEVQIDFAYYVRFGPRDEIGIDIDGMRVLIDRIAEILASFRIAFD